MKSLLDGKSNEKQYEVLKKIGSGGFGEVYLANDLINKKQVAVKVFQQSLEQDDETVVDWEREAEQALTLKDDHIIEAYEFVHPTPNDETPAYYLVMQLADRGSVRGLIDSQKNAQQLLDEVTLVDLFKQMLLGLRVIHQTYLHRDIKPENMLFAGDVLKLSDFGLAKHIDQATRTRTYKGWGTYKYMAPESWTLGKMSPATDIYSLGIVLFELATLQLPFSSADVVELENLHRYGERPRVRSINSRISTKLDGIIYRMMMQPPSSRYQSIDEILNELEKTPPSAPLSPTLQRAAGLAQQLYTQKTAQMAAQQKRDDNKIERTKLNVVKVGEFVQVVNDVIEKFNQAAPESKIFLSMGDRDHYTVIWDGIDLITLSIQPFLETIKLKGQSITSYVDVSFRVPARPNEGMCFVLCIDENDLSDYGQWKVLENTFSPLITSPGVYPLSAEISQLQNLQRQGNAMGQFQYEIRDGVAEELETTIAKALEYHQQSLVKRERFEAELSDWESDDGFGY